MGVPYLFPVESVYFCYLGAHAKFHNPTTAPSGRTSKEPEREGGNFSSHVSEKSKKYLILESLYFCELGALAKFQNPMTTLLGDYLRWERKEKEISWGRAVPSSG